jgi:polyphosphate kinase
MTAATAEVRPRFLNRELSHLDFNGRVLELASDESVPLLDRVNFCSIFSGNMDEFFMVRVAGLMDQVAAGVTRRRSDGTWERVQGKKGKRTQSLHGALMRRARARARRAGGVARPR